MVLAGWSHPDGAGLGKFVEVETGSSSSLENESALSVLLNELRIMVDFFSRNAIPILEGGRIRS